MSNIISSDWLNRSVLEVAPDLLGCTLVRQLADGQILRGQIVEVEAYQAGDPACHGYRKKTDRNAMMFSAAGVAYVYLIYGLYHCLNIVTDREAFASAVLIRALQLESYPTERLPPKQKFDRLAAGPGKLCQVLEIDRRLNGCQLEPGQGLWLEARSPQWQQDCDRGAIAITQTSRIGITQGVDLLWRWYLQDCAAVSRR
ncbi:MAG: DNA-3-methyladenine glycosylase [Synechococcales bacterium]|nr:DNA-3-methyladenine glycosylase [Synechococcales bacterium]